MGDVKSSLAGFAAATCMNIHSLLPKFYKLMLMLSAVSKKKLTSASKF